MDEQVRRVDSAASTWESRACNNAFHLERGRKRFAYGSDVAFTRGIECRAVLEDDLLAT